MATRTIEVDKQWYAQLAQYLEPAERWAPPDSTGLILYVWHWDGNEPTKLVFVPVVEGESNDGRQGLPEAQR